MMHAEQRFVEAARRHGVATREGDPKVANRAYADMVSALKELRGAPDKGVAFLSGQLHNDDASVVTWAALYLLPTKEKEALDALQRVVAQRIPLVSFSADMTLREWRAGRLEIE